MPKTAAAEVININKDVIQFDITNLSIEALKEKYSGLQITPGNGQEYRAVKAALSDVRSRRIAVEKRRKELKAEALEFGRAVDSRARDITEMLTPLEEELKAIKQVEDDRIAAIKAEKERLEQERMENIMKRIHDIETHLHGIERKTSAELTEIINTVQNINIDIETYQERKYQAELEQHRVLNVLEDARMNRIVFETEEAERQAEAARLEEQRKAQEAEAARLRAEQEKIEAANRAEQERIAKEQAEREAELQKERDAIEMEKAKIAKEKEDAELKRKAEAEAKAQAEREELERLKAEKARQERLAKEEADRQAEEARQKALMPDKDLLKDFAQMMFDLHLPPVKSPEAVKLANSIQEQLWNLAHELHNRAIEL